MSAPTQWYWHLGKSKAVRADERGPGDQTLGPYPSKAEAENWQATSASRNDAWDDDDEKWDNAGTSDDDE